MATLEQIRAARALLGWSQKDLADRAGLSQTGIARLENGTHKPNSQTLERIYSAFDAAGIEFLGEQGLQKKTTAVEILKGQKGFQSFMDDVYEVARDVGGPICLFNGLPEKLTAILGDEWYEMHAARMADIRHNFNFRVIIKSGERRLIGKSFATYRWFPVSLFHDQTFYAYGDRLAFLNFGPGEDRVLVLRQKEFADSFRVLFNIAWDLVAQTAPEGIP